MADHITLFAAEFDLRNPQNLVRARLIYEEPPDHQGHEVAFRDGFSLDVDEAVGSSRLRIIASRSGDTSSVIRFVQRCAEEFKLTGLWAFEWAHTSSAPTLHGFGGGALVLDLASGQTIAWNDTHSWLVRMLARAGEVS